MKHKLLEKINLIDLLVLIVLIAALAVGVKLAVGRLAKQDLETVSFTFYLDEVSDFVAEKVQPGCRLYDDYTDTDLGVCLDLAVEDAVSYATASDGRIVMSSREKMKSIRIRGEVQGVKAGNGVEVNGVQYCVGDWLVLRAGDAKLYLFIYDLSVKE